MALSSEYQHLAKRLGITQLPGQSDQDFMRWLDNLRAHVALVREAKEIGVPVEFGMTSREIRQATCKRQLALLQERGFTPEARVTLKAELCDRNVKITKIVSEGGHKPKVTVHFWIISPWTNANNQGRANHRSAKEFLDKAKLAP